MPTEVEALNVLTPEAQIMKLGTRIQQIEVLVNELRTDHATTKTAVDEGKTLTDELRADHGTNKTMTDEMHVDVDLNGAALEAILAKLDGDAGITDTNYVAVHGRSGSGTSIQAAAITATDVPTITAAEATAGPATITAAAVDALTG